MAQLPFMGRDIKSVGMYPAVISRWGNAIRLDVRAAKNTIVDLWRENCNSLIHVEAEDRAVQNANGELQHFVPTRTCRVSLVSPGDWCADVKRGADTGTVSPPLTVALDQAQNRADTSAWLMSTKLWPEEGGARGKPRKLARGP